MANKSISQLTAGGAVSGTDLFPDVQTAGVGPVKVTATQLATFFWYQPTLVNPALGAATATSINIGGATLGSNVLAVNGTTLLGGATTVSTGGLTIGVAGTTGGTIALKGSTAGTLTLQVPATVTDYSITLPSAVAAGNGYILTSTTGGVTSWTNPTSLGIDLDVGTTAITNGTVGRLLFEGAGNVLQESANLTFSTAALTLGVQQTTQGSLVLANTAAGAYGVTLVSSNSATAGWTMTLPVAAPAGNSYVLTSTTAGVTSWSNPTALGIDLDVGTTAITNGTSTNILYNNAGVLGEYTVTGTGTTAVLSTSPTFTTSIIDPLVIGGTDTTSTLTLRSTSGVGTTGADIIFQTGNNGATEAMRVLNSGNILISTVNTPSNKDTVTPKVVITGSGVAGSAQIVRHTTVGGGGGILEISSTRGTDVNSYTILQDGDGVGSLVFSGADGNEFTPAASIQCQVDGTPGDNDMPGRLLFNTTADGGSSVTERARINSSGNLLLGGTAARGTTAGTAHLDIFNGTAPVGTLTNGISLYSSSGDFHFMDAAGSAYKVGFRNVPAVGTKTSSYQLATADVGKYVQVSTGGAITIPDATFAEGDIISIFNNTTGNITITCSITTAYIAGTDTDKATMTLATRGVATVLFISSTVCVVSGNVS